ncbi:hypothetical protein ACWD6P_22585 [Streptomyces sp. NPDC002446]
MTGHEEHHDAVLAEILLSKKVGVGHIRLVGDVISTRAQLSMGMQGSVGLSLDQHAEIVEVVLDLEDAYRSAWAGVSAAPDFEQRIPKLETLERALKDAVEGILEIARQNQIEVERCHLQGESGA